MPISLNTFFGHLDIASLGGKSSQRKPESIGTVLVNDIQGIDDITL